MNHHPFARVLCILFLIGVQTPLALSQRRAPVRSPEIEADGKVTFRLQAPEATAVDVVGQWPDGVAPLEKSENGIWQVTVASIPAGVWEYSLRVDGLSMIDPGNPAIKPMRSPRTSILLLPGEPPLIHDYQDVPHGTLHLHTYRSKSLGQLRELVVYTPPGYASDEEQKFPVLYLQHGSGDNQATWTVHGKAHWILDNLLAQQRATPMLVVMMDGHAAGPGEGRGGNNTEYFEKDLLQDVIPFVEANYQVQPGAEHRGIAGLSMGGGQSLTIGLNHADMFAWVGGFSSAIPNTESVAGAMQDPNRTNEQLRLLWIACGKDDFLKSRNEEFIGQLKEKGITHEWQLTEGNHSWPVWRGYLADFVPKLFH